MTALVIVIIILLFALTIAFDYRPVRKQRETREKIVYFSFLAISFCVLMLNELGVRVPGPTEPIQSAVDMILGK